MSSQEKLRLNKALSMAKIGARRQCEALIVKGKVKVNGEEVRNPGHLIDLSVDQIECEGAPISLEFAPKLYLKLNKPTGYICSHKTQGRSVYDLFEDFNTKLFTIGRLDKKTSGLLIVTNDGDFAQKLAHPKYQVSKEYLVKTDTFLLDHHLKRVAQGTVVEGKHVKPKKIIKVRKTTAKVVVIDGRKHEVRELFKAAGIEVIELTRIRIGNLRLGSLPLGHYQEMTPRECQALLQG